MTVQERTRSKWILWSFLALVAAATVSAYLGFRAQARLASELRAQALAQGLSLEVGKAERDGFAIVFHDVKLRFKGAPGIRASLNRVRVDGALFGSRQATIDEARFTFAGNPSELYQSLGALPTWQGLPLIWQRIGLEYSDPLLGKAVVEDLSLTRSGSAFRIRAGEAKWGSAAARNVALSLDKRNQLFELGFGEPDGKTQPTQLGYFGSNRGASQWMLSARQQPFRALAQVFGWEFGAPFEETLAVVSASLLVPDDRARATRGNLEMVIDRWPRPNWPESLALLGDTAAFTAHVEGPDKPAPSWELTHVSLSLSLFTLTGPGRLYWGNEPSLSLDLAGKLNCAQLRGNLPASSYLDQVKQYLAPEPALAKPEADARLREEVQLKLRLRADKAASGKREAAWHLDAGCGLSALDSAVAP